MATFVSGQNLANPNARTLQPDYSKAKVSGGINRPALGKEEYIEQKPKDASYSQEGSTYNPATNALEQKKQPPVSEKAIVSNSIDQSSPTNINGSYNNPFNQFIPTEFQRQNLNLSEQKPKEQKPFSIARTIDTGLNKAGSTVLSITPSYKNIPFIQKVTNPFYSILTSREVLSTKVPISVGNLAVGSFFSPYMVSTSGYSKSFTPARPIETFASNRVGVPEPYFETISRGAIQPVGKRTYNVESQFISKSGDYTYTGSNIQQIKTGKISLTRTLENQGFTISQTKIKSTGISKGITTFDETGFKQPSLSVYYKIGKSVKYPDITKFKSFTATSSGIQEQISGTKLISNNRLAVRTPDYLGIYKILSPKEQGGTGTYIIKGGGSSSKTITDVATKLRFADIGSSISKSSSNILSSITKGNQYQGIISGLSSSLKSITTTKPVQEIKSVQIQRRLQPSLTWQDVIHKTKNVLVNPPNTKTSTTPSPVPALRYVSVQPQPEFQQPKQTFNIPQISVPIIPIPPIQTSPQIIPFGSFTLPLFEQGRLSTRLYKGKQRKKYTPSYEALIFNLRGKAPKKLTGFGTRPITKGFKWEFGRFKL